MKQGIKTIQNLYGELERQREARKDLIADIRSINISSTNGVSMLSVSTGEDILSYRITDIARLQTDLISPTSIMSVCVLTILLS